MNDIKSELLNLCVEMGTFWKGLYKAANEIPADHPEDIVLLWQNYFAEHGDIVGTLSLAKYHIDEMKIDLIMKGILHFETQEVNIDDELDS